MKMPAFKSADQNGEPFNSASLKGEKSLIYFFPRADTPTCTAQSCDLRDNYAVLKKAGFHIIGISTDKIKTQKKFEQKYKLPFTLLADEDHMIADKFGVWGEKKFMGMTFNGVRRTTFLIDEEGTIRHTVTGVGKNHRAENLLKIWNGK